MKRGELDTLLTINGESYETEYVYTVYVRLETA